MYIKELCLNVCMYIQKKIFMGLKAVNFLNNNSHCVRNLILHSHVLKDMEKMCSHENESYR